MLFNFASRRDFQNVRARVCKVLLQYYATRGARLRLLLRVGAIK